MQVGDENHRIELEKDAIKELQKSTENISEVIDSDEDEFMAEALKKRRNFVAKDHYYCADLVHGSSVEDKRI